MSNIPVNTILSMMESWDDDNLPDGAWFAMLQDGAEQCADQLGVPLKRTQSYDLVQAYIQKHATTTDHETETKEQ